MDNIVEISDLKKKVASVIALLEKFKTQNIELELRNEEYVKQNDLYAYKLSELQQQFETLKTAKSITASAKDVHETKIRINGIVREIDKCIGMLNK